MSRWWDIGLLVTYLCYFSFLAVVIWSSAHERGVLFTVVLFGGGSALSLLASRLPRAYRTFRNRQLMREIRRNLERRR